VKNSTTILLPKWYQTLTAHGLPHRIIPRDVATRWNSTFDMLDFAVKYRPAIDTMTAARDLGLRNYELDQAEWKIAEDLGGVLKVSQYLMVFHPHTNQLSLGFQRRYTVLFPCYSESSLCHPCDGPHR
jgi:hypothetical protein